MHYMLFAMSIGGGSTCGAFAITWDFADGSTYGWTARESSQL